MQAAQAAGLGASGGLHPSIEVKIDDGLLTLRADDAPLAEVLRSLADAAAFRVTLHGDFAEPVTIALLGQPVWRALVRLSAGHSVVALSSKSGTGPDDWKLRDVRIYENARHHRDGRPEKAAAARADGRNDVVATPNPLTAEILAELAEADQLRRAAAVAKVGALPPPEAVKILSGVLSDQAMGERVRSRAIAALTRIKGRNAGALLRERALNDKDAPVRVQAINALAATAGAQAISTLGRVLRLERNPGVRSAAVDVLARLGGEPARTQVEYATLDAHSEVRAAARRALAAWAGRPG
jgi:HEAT repeat protein